GEDGVIGKMNEMVDQLLAVTNKTKDQVAGIGVGVPGPIDAQSGVVQQAVNLGWKNVALKQKLEQLSQLAVYVENDANAAALGEMWRGAGQGSDNLVMITLGTGVGGGIIVNGQVVHGVNGVGGEIGHITLEPTGGPLCNCGKTGCLENYASATAIIREGTKAAEEGRSELLAKLLA
ncbi:ROK family protein, partial [Microbacteriaceae bacterium K1510]|nr:ROK family protein [Microbacteriaceae bacterium K1510]